MIEPESLKASTSQIFLNEKTKRRKCQPVDITFRNIVYNIEVEDKEQESSSCFSFKKYKQKALINNVSGTFKAGELTAIMGSSGAGKSTLLNILAGRIPKDKIQGEVTANGHPFDFNEFGGFANYVMQQDVLIETLTVRETLEFAADLKMNVSEETKHRRIDRLIKKFKLNRCADIQVGGIVTKGISGGEKKRTCIAFELISDPSVLVLDEPTSGLDSLTSFIIIKYMKKLT